MHAGADGATAATEGQRDKGTEGQRDKGTERVTESCCEQMGERVLWCGCAGSVQELGGAGLHRLTTEPDRKIIMTRKSPMCT